ncbi:hypothetical protein FRC03_003235 [Tulasnella sp. 419]|nr:hypothetical protein FRC02_005355 [Tulasnella sp. 418]KAG8963233.1 hypothetical protein FRC03_003235 [Tulasnella sp. 419]
MRFSSIIVSAILFVTAASAAHPHHHVVGRHRARSVPRKRQQCKAQASANADKGKDGSFNIQNVQATTSFTTITLANFNGPKPTTFARTTTIVKQPVIQTTAAVTSAKPPAQTSSGGSSGLNASQQEYLNRHNSFRAQHGAAPLSWSASAEAAAQVWANKCVFQHGGGKAGGFGENLAAGTGGFSIQAAIDAWTIKEVGAYNPQNPTASHFTQVVWKGTTQVGCAVAVCDNNIFPGAKANYHVCEYFPAGNVIGFFDQNVQL